MPVPDRGGRLVILQRHAPQSLAKAASERIRSGLSPKTINIAAAVFAPTAKPSRRVGAVSTVRIPEGLQGLSQHRRRVDENLLERDHGRGPGFDRGIACDFELPHHPTVPSAVLGVDRNVTSCAAWANRTPLTHRRCRWIQGFIPSCTWRRGIAWWR